MLNLPGLEPIDYLVIGHLTKDLTPDGPQLGGTAAFAARTAQALGLRVGIVTSWGEEVSAELLDGITIINQKSEHSTTFENTYTPSGRTQTIHNIAYKLDYYHIPELWRQTRIIHLGPVAQEINPTLVRHFPDALVGLTIQGWLREWDHEGKVHPSEWPEALYILRQASAAVISEEDVENNPDRIQAMAEAARILVVTQGEKGATLYTEGAQHHLPAPFVPRLTQPEQAISLLPLFSPNMLRPEMRWNPPILLSRSPPTRSLEAVLQAPQVRKTYIT
jgi:sugar/nucleoside kinase (ribokinase family)